MDTHTAHPALPAVENLPGPQALFSRVLVGIDASAEAREAVRQAALLMDGKGSLELLAAYEVVYPAAVSGPAMMRLTDAHAELYEEAASDSLKRARECVDRDDVVEKLVRVRPADALLAEIEHTDATLVAVGSHGHHRTAGILLGSVATEIVHRAPCSVLVARGGLEEPIRTIVVGVDGSEESRRAHDVAKALAVRFDAHLWPVVAWAGKPVDRAAVDAIATRREDSPDEPVHALVAASADASLLVVGSRGLHGLRSLGSVSERVAHESQTSTLIVRG